MNKEQQRIAIAEACGWKWHSRSKGKIKVWDNGLDYVFYDSDLPDYLNDLNAMHEAEKTLSQKDKREYAYQLNGGYYTSGLDDTFDIVYATVAQRAEAFLKTIDKWTTTQPTNQPMNQCNDPDHGAINAERAESRGLRKAWVELDDKRQVLERQRDKLAEALRKIKNAGGGYDDPYDELDFIDGVTFEALQSLTTTEP